MSRNAILAILFAIVIAGLTGCKQPEVPTAVVTTPSPLPSAYPTITSHAATTPTLANQTPPSTVSRPPLPTATATTGAATMTAIAALSTCRAADLTIVDGGENAAMGMRFHILYFWNRGTASCSLVGTPGVEFLDQHDIPILTSAPQASSSAQNPYTSAPYATVVLLHGQDKPIAHHGTPGYALVEIATSTQGPNAGTCIPLDPTPRQLRLTLPATDDKLLLDWAYDTCNRRFSVSPFH